MATRTTAFSKEGSRGGGAAGDPIGTKIPVGPLSTRWRAMRVMFCIMPQKCSVVARFSSHRDIGEGDYRQKRLGRSPLSVLYMLGVEGLI